MKESKYHDRHGNLLRCAKCNAPLIWDILTSESHNDDACVGRQLQQAQAEVKKLKKSLDEWKDAWFLLRDIIGWLWWHHPALNNEDQLQYYQNNLKVLKEKHEQSSEP